MMFREEPLDARGSGRVARALSLEGRMRRETISPPAGMTPPAGWGSWVQDADGAGGDVAEASGEDVVPTRSTCACPICGLDLSSWTLPDRETHADACVARALEGGTTVSPRETRGVRHDRPPRRAETNAETHAEMDPSISAGGGASCDAFLNRHGLARYAPAFAREALFPSDLPSLTREDLRDVLGVRDERDAATFFAAVLGPRSSATDGIGAVRPFVSEDGGGERRGAEQTRDRQTSNDPRFMSTITTKEEARLASLEQHDDEWTRLAMAMSASMRDAPRASFGDANVSPVANANASSASVPADSRRAEPSVAPNAARSSAIRQTTLRDVTNERDERDERVKPTRIATLPEAHPFRRPRDEARGETVLEAARALGRRSVPSSLWGAAGHGGRDREIPEWVLGGEKPRVTGEPRMTARERDT